MDNIITATDLLNLIIDGFNKGYRNVKVVFKPAYEEDLHSNLSEKLIKILKTPKTEIFDIVTEGSDIIKLLKSEDVETINYV